ncbi:MAG: hypothetical protein JXA69_06005, partial [Phycisphaerae bacterium]|nr:hypothetical protein [Phycisphaerae bacterium]
MARKDTRNPPPRGSYDHGGGSGGAATCERPSVRGTSLPDPDHPFEGNVAACVSQAVFAVCIMSTACDGPVLAIIRV